MNKEGNLIDELRADLDEIDSDIAELLEERFDICLQIAREKRAEGLPLENSAREKAVIEKLGTNCPKYRRQADTVFKTVIEASKSIQRKKLNLYLTGMPNSGKSKLAGKLGILLGRRSIDTDSMIMHGENTTIDRIFDDFGEAHFRELEHNALKSAAAIGGLVVATGGGVLTYAANLPILKNSGITVFLDRDPECLLRARIKNRPLIRGGEEDIMRLYNERIEQYRSFADLCVDPDDEAAVHSIAEFFNSRIV